MKTNELGEEIIVDDLSLNDIMGWTEKKQAKYVTLNKDFNSDYEKQN